MVLGKEQLGALSEPGAVLELVAVTPRFLPILGSEVAAFFYRDLGRKGIYFAAARGGEKVTKSLQYERIPSSAVTIVDLHGQFENTPGGPAACVPIVRTLGDPAAVAAHLDQLRTFGALPSEQRILIIDGLQPIAEHVGEDEAVAFVSRLLTVPKVKVLTLTVIEAQTTLFQRLAKLGRVTDLRDGFRAYR